jgi:phosphoribosylformylglycinamidine (FGAM) synthase-like enzyme
VDDGPLRGRRIGIPGVVTELRFYYRYHTNQLLNAVIAVVAPLVIYQSATLQDCII